MSCLAAAVILSAAVPSLRDFQCLRDEDKVVYLDAHLKAQTLSEVPLSASDEKAWALHRDAMTRRIEMIWSDTILEGDYAVFGETQTEIQTVASLSEAYAYTFKVSRDGVFLAGKDCDLNKVTHRFEGASCVFGTIVETHYADLNFFDLGPTGSGFVSFRH